MWPARFVPATGGADPGKAPEMLRSAGLGRYFDAYHILQRQGGFDRRVLTCRTGGWGLRRMGRASAPILLFSLSTVLGLTGCVESPVNLDPLSVNGRDGGGPVPSYPMLMRIGAAAHAGGDFPNAVGVYRRAAELAPQEPAPLIAAGNALLQMGAVNEAIVSYNAALVRPGDTSGARWDWPRRS